MKRKFYGVRVGLSGPAVYCDWEACAKATKGFSGAIFRSFSTREDARNFAYGRVGSQPFSQPLSQTPLSQSNPSPQTTQVRRRQDLGGDGSIWLKLVSQTFVPLTGPGTALFLWFDGGSRNNQAKVKGAGGSGSVLQIMSTCDGDCRKGSNLTHNALDVKEDDPRLGVVREVWAYTPSVTNNEAEYSGLILGLNACLQFLESKALAGVEVTSLTVRGDSKLVINQVTGEWRANQLHLGEKRDVARGLLDRIEVKLAEAAGGGEAGGGRRVNLVWVEVRVGTARSPHCQNVSVVSNATTPTTNPHRLLQRAENSKADALANRAMDSKVGNCLAVDDWVTCRCLGGPLTGGNLQTRGIMQGGLDKGRAKEDRVEPPPKRNRKETVVAEAHV